MKTHSETHFENENMIVYSQASPNLTHAPGTKFLGQLPKNGARGFIRVTPAWLQKAVNGTVRKHFFSHRTNLEKYVNKILYFNFPTTL